MNVPAQAIDGFIADVADVMFDALRDTREYALPRPILTALRQSVERREFPPLDVLTAVVARACYLDGRVRDAAHRLSFALHHRHVTYRPRPTRSDGSFD